MNISLLAAKSDNGVIGNDEKIPWHAKEVQTLSVAITYNQWLLVGRKNESNKETHK